MIHRLANMTQDDLSPELPLYARVKPAHRAADPSTSVEAARVAQKGASGLQREILRVLRMFGPQTDETIFEQLPAFATFSPSGRVT